MPLTHTGYGEQGYGLGGYGTDSVSPDAAPGTALSAPAIIAHQALGLLRVAKQYQNSPNFLALLQAILSVMDELEATLQAVSMLADIDTMTGANLDTIGVIVGASRNVSSVVVLTYFGFDISGDYWMVRMGEEADRTLGSRFYEEGEPFMGSNVLADSEFKMLIRAKILKNNSRGTGEDALAALAYLFQAPVRVVDNYDMTFSVAVGRAITATELAILNSVDILPRPAAVSVSAITTF